jgi:hypothetical protein
MNTYRRNREREENLKLESGLCAHCSGVHKVTLNGGGHYEKVTRKK